MRLKVILAITSAAIIVGAGTAIAAHAPEIDPATGQQGSSSRTTPSRTSRSRRSLGQWNRTAPMSSSST